MSKNKTEKTTRSLPVPLTEHQELELGRSIAELRLNIDNLRVEKAVMSKEFKDKINGMEITLSEMSKNLKEKCKPEDVECEWVNDDPDPGMKTLYRKDTGEQVETRSMELFD